MTKRKKGKKGKKRFLLTRHVPAVSTPIRKKITLKWQPPRLRRLQNETSQRNTSVINNPPQQSTPRAAQAPKESLLLPLLGLNSLGRDGLDLACLDIIPIGAKGGPVALDEALHHGALLLGCSTLVQLLEEEVNIILVLFIVSIFYLVPVLGSGLAAGGICWAGGFGIFLGCRRGRSCLNRFRGHWSRSRSLDSLNGNISASNLLLSPSFPLETWGGLLQDQLDLARCGRPP